MSDMKRWLVIFHQPGGCDYTIGCGIEVSDIVEAPDAATAARIATDYHYGEDATFEHEMELDSIKVYEVVGEPHQLWPEIQAAAKKRAAENRERAERKRDEAEFERLQAKLGRR